MRVKDMNPKVTSSALNEQLQSVYQWDLKLDEMKAGNASKIIDAMAKKIRSIKESTEGHRAEKSPTYMEAVLVSDTLKAWMAEQARKGEELLRPKTMFDAYVRTDEDALPREAAQRRTLLRIKLTDRGMMREFVERYGAERGPMVFEATLTRMALGRSIELPLAEVLAEGQLDQARAVMAARDIVDNIQSMIQKFSNILNDDLPSLQDVIRDEIGDTEAQSFASVANDALNPLLTSLRDARQKLDDATRAIASGQAPGVTPMDMGGDPNAAPTPDMATPGVDPTADLGAPPAEDDSEFDAADVAAGGDAELGRGKR